MSSLGLVLFQISVIHSARYGEPVCRWFDRIGVPPILSVVSIISYQHLSKCHLQQHGKISLTVGDEKPV